MRAPKKCAKVLSTRTYDRHRPQRKSKPDAQGKIVARLVGRHFSPLSLFRSTCTTTFGHDDDGNVQPTTMETMARGPPPLTKRGECMKTVSQYTMKCHCLLSKSVCAHYIRIYVFIFRAFHMHTLRMMKTRVCPSA